MKSRNMREGWYAGKAPRSHLLHKGITQQYARQRAKPHDRNRVRAMQACLAIVRKSRYTRKGN